MSDVATTVEKTMVAAGVVPASAEPLVEAVEAVRELPRVVIQVNELATAEELGRVLWNCEGRVFSQNKRCVVIEDAEEGGGIEVVEMCSRKLPLFAAKYASIETWGGKKAGGTIPAALSVDLASKILKSSDFIAKLRPLRRIAHVRRPIMRDNGAVELLPFGYDERSGTLTLPGVDFREDLKIDEAREMIRDLLKDFPFADRDADRRSRNEAVVVAMMVSLFAPWLIDVDRLRMGFMITSNASRSGKTLLAKMAAGVVHGHSYTMAKPDSEENMEKKLDTAALNGDQYIILDNVRGFFHSEALEGFMTQPWHSGRRFHSQSKFTVRNLATVIVTGNGMEVIGDFEHRCLHCKMHVDEADVQDRSIERDFEGADFERGHWRVQVLACLWAFVRDWAEKRPKVAGRVRKGFEAWCRVFGAIVENAGFGSPLADLLADESANTEYEDMKAIVTALAEGVTDYKDFTFDHVIQTAWRLNAFPLMLKGKTYNDSERGEVFEPDMASCSRFGKLLNKNYGGKVFKIGTRRIRWDKRGIKRTRAYVLKVEKEDL